MIRTELTELKNRLSEIVERHYDFKNAYFWTPNRSASGRRAAEKRNNDYFKNERYGIIAENSYSESCKYVYYKGIFYVDGIKTTVTKIKNIIKALEVII